MKQTFIHQKKPAIFQFMTPCTFVEEFAEDDKLFDSAQFSEQHLLNVTKEGFPLYCALFKTPPTNCHTPGKYVPGGYTSSGKWKAGHTTSAKTDKRAGQ